VDTARIAAALREIGQRPDEAIDLAETALLLAALDHADIDLAPYRAHLAALAAEVADAARVGTPRLDALKDVLVGRHGYAGDQATYDDLANADLIRVIDRRRGLPVALSILWMHAARAQGWTADGLGFPSHFLIRLDVGPSFAVLDPFNGGQALEPPALRSLLQRLGGAEAELRAEYLQPVGTRAVLLRLQNNIKLRLLQARRGAAALAVVERMILVAPRDPALWHEAAMLHRGLDNLKAAMACLEQVAALAPALATRHGVEAEIAALRSRLN
jgi:regulator of sirC expression with transglutaminase-like and TPR domain